MARCSRRSTTTNLSQLRWVCTLHSCCFICPDECCSFSTPHMCINISTDLFRWNVCRTFYMCTDAPSEGYTCEVCSIQIKVKSWKKVWKMGARPNRSLLSSYKVNPIEWYTSDQVGGLNKCVAVEFLYCSLRKLFAGWIIWWLWRLFPDMRLSQRYMVWIIYMALSFSDVEGNSDFNIGHLPFFALIIAGSLTEFWPYIYYLVL